MCHEASGDVSCLIVTNKSSWFLIAVAIRTKIKLANKLGSALSDCAKRKPAAHFRKGSHYDGGHRVHSVVKHCFKPPINCPADYIARIRLLRSKPPHNVKVLIYEVFKNYKTQKPT